MTTVAALARDGAVFMAADSMIDVYDRPIHSVPKIQRHKAADGSEVLIGWSGMAALTTVLDLDLKLRDMRSPTDFASLDAFVLEIARKLTSSAMSAHLAEDGKMSGGFLLGHAGRLWTIFHMLAVPHLDGVAAIGSGEGPAMGAMDALLAASKLTALTYEEIVHKAVEIAITRDLHSRGPIQFEVLSA